MSFYDEIFADIKRTHVIVNAEAGHGKSTSIKTLISELKKREPKIIIKVFDVSNVWFDNAPLKWRQRIDGDVLIRFLRGEHSFDNLPDCIYEMGDLGEDECRFFTAMIVKQDYESRRAVAKQYGMKAVKDLPFVIYVFEEADMYFDSTGLNTKRDFQLMLENKEGRFQLKVVNPAEKLRSFIKVGRNFGMRGLCIVTASVGELATKLRRRSKHIIGRIINDSDVREYNKKVKNMGNLALQIERFHWLYYNGENVFGPFRIEDTVTQVPTDYVIEHKKGDITIKVGEPPQLNPWPAIAFILICIIFILLMMK